MKKILSLVLIGLFSFVLIGCDSEGSNDYDVNEDSMYDDDYDSTEDEDYASDDESREFDKFMIRNLETGDVVGLGESLEAFEAVFGEAEFHRENSDDSREYAFQDAGSDFLVRFVDDEAVKIRVSHRQSDLVEFYGDLEWDMTSLERLAANFVNSPNDSFFHRRYHSADGWEDRSLTRDGDVLGNYLSTNTGRGDDDSRNGVIEIYIPGNR